MENYVHSHDMPFELLRYPIADQELCACTFIREQRMFVLVNTSIPVAKQIFASAHELYHIYCFADVNDTDLPERGSILNSMTIDDDVTLMEDMEANAFAGLLLAPPDRIEEQMRIYGIKRGEISLDDVLMLMEIFAIPYKAIILRLFEDGIITQAGARGFFTISQKDVMEKIELSGKAARWQQIPQMPIRLGSLMEKMKVAEDLESVRNERIKDDRDIIRRIKESISAH
ncbi:MAG: ImmA/IrrE family metallo-endopeptidase [Bullifex sp.]